MMNDRLLTSLASLRLSINEGWVFEACLIVYPSLMCSLGSYLKHAMVTTTNVFLTHAPSVFCVVGEYPVFDQYGQLDIVKGR